MGGTTIKIQKGISIFEGLVVVADAAARGKLRYKNNEFVVICVRNTYRVIKKRQAKKVKIRPKELSQQRENKKIIVDNM